MRRVMLLALLALALPTAALANSLVIVPKTFTTGSFERGRCSNNGIGSCAHESLHQLHVLIQGSLFDISIAALLSPPLSHCPGHMAGTCYDIVPAGFHFSSVSALHCLDIECSSAHGFFGESLASGIVDRNGNFFAILATTKPNPLFPLPHDNVKATFTVLHGFDLANGRAKVEGFVVIPEPGTLGLLGTGLIGLAGMARLKLKVGT